MISDQEKSLSKFKKVYHSCSAQEKKICLGSVISNQTLLYRYVIYYIYIAKYIVSKFITYKAIGT